VFSQGRGDGLEIKQLDDLMLAQEIKTIYRNGIKFLNADYFNECLYGLKERVLIKYSLFDLSKIRVYALKGKFLCEAQRVMPLHPMANYLGDVQDMEELKQALKRKKQLENKTKNEVEKFWKPNEKILEWQNAPQIEIINKVEIEPIKEISQGRPVFESRYER
jgi:putative transposase